jgi:hypothetical protein
MGAKMTPTPNSSGRTVLGVRMGCHAFRRCWRNAVSVLHNQPCAHYPAQCAVSCSPTYSEASGSFASCPARHSLVCYLNRCDPWCAACWVTNHWYRGGGLDVGCARCRSSSFLSVRQRWLLRYLSTRVCDGSWRSVTTALHRRAANCVLFGTKWNAEFA